MLTCVYIQSRVYTYSHTSRQDLLKPKKKVIGQCRACYIHLKFADGDTHTVCVFSQFMEILKRFTKMIVIQTTPRIRLVPKHIRAPSFRSNNGAPVGCFVFLLPAFVFGCFSFSGY